jgi:hypothetical protein
MRYWIGVVNPRFEILNAKQYLNPKYKCSKQSIE